MKKNTNLRQNKGITLIALVITIIVLLILAGISIAMLTGDNGLLTKAVQAKTETKLAEIEEAANLAYLELTRGKISGDDDGSDMASKVIEELRSKGYTIEEKPNAGGSVTGISLETSNVTVEAGKTADIEVKLEGNLSGSSYYALVDGNYYEIIFQSNGSVRVSRTETKLSGKGTKLDATSGDSKIVSVEGTTASTVTVKGGTTGGSTTVTIQYGSLEPVTCTVTVVVRPTGTEVSSNPTNFSTEYGLIDVIWLNGTGKTTADITTVPNEPKLSGMTPVTWTENKDADGNITSWTEDETANSNWYSYRAGDGKTDTKTSEWANAKNADGSYFVWIPRFAYRITYYEDSGYTKVTGCYDGDGMWNAVDGTRRLKIDDGTETVTDTQGNKYIIHPAFGSNKELGGWRSDITGFWVAKYEMSRENSSDDGTTWDPQGTYDGGGGNTIITDLNKSSIRVVSKPYTENSEVSSWGFINIGNMYINSFGYDRAKESHLMKNSEWGAVAYLAQSQYGRNGNEVTINNSFYTGIAGDTVSADVSSSTTNTYNTSAGALASTTGNVYGIYDMSGGAWERVAAWDTDAEDSNNYISSNGSSFASKDRASTEYATAYHNGTSSDSGNSTLYKVGKIGDATKEVNKGGAYSPTNAYQYFNWFGDTPYVAYSDFPFFDRGGNSLSSTGAGVYTSGCYSGSDGDSFGFREVLVS